MDYEYFLQRIHGVIMPSTGCTEPVAIALNTATARANARGEVRHLTITLDNYLYKNAMGRRNSRRGERGVALCAAMGVTAGDATAKMRVLDHVSPEALSAAKKMVAEGRVTVKTRSDVHGLLVESVLETDRDTVRVLTRNRIRTSSASIMRRLKPMWKMRTAARRATPSATASCLR